MTTGVSFDKRDRKWRAYIGENYRLIYLGQFASEDEAIQARLDAEKKYGKPRNDDPSRIWLIEGNMALVEVFPDQLALIDAKNIETVREGGRWYMFGRYPASTITRCRLHQHILRNKGNGHSIHTDHIDRNPLNNLEKNLRIVTPSKNVFNSGLYKHNRSGVKGVHWNKQTRRWQARIEVNGKVKHLGYFTNIEDARRAREIAERELGIEEMVP